MQRQLNTDIKFLQPADHVDMNILHLPHENGLFFGERYFRDNRTFLDHLVKQVKPKLVNILPDENGLPINSLPLPDGGVYMDKAASESKWILDNLGIRVETTSKPLGAWAWGGCGGIHCSTNTLWLPELPFRKVYNI